MLFRPTSERQLNSALLLLRVITGATLLAHGAQKLFVYGFAGVSGAFTQMGIPMPGIIGPLIALLEFFGGIALVIGLLTRLAAVGLAIDMLGAALLVHLKNGFFLPQGAEFVLVLFGATAALALTGAGAFSVDTLIARRTSASGGVTSLSASSGSGRRSAA